MEAIHSNKFKNRVIFMLLIVIGIMLVAVMALAKKGPIEGPGNHHGGRFKIEITNIREFDKKGFATSLSKPACVDSYATFNVLFKAPGDYMVYEVEFSNLGTIDAVLDSFTYNTTSEDDIVYEIIGINQNDILKSGEKMVFKIKVSYSSIVTEIRNFNKPISIYFNFVQA